MHLANLFVKGVEIFSLANDVCGNPLEAFHFRLKNYFNGIFFQLSYGYCISNNKEFFKKELSSDEMHYVADFPDKNSNEFKKLIFFLL